MTLDRGTDRELTTQLLDLYLEPAPSYRYDVLAQTRHLRQRPRWTFPERWLPVAVLSLPRALAPTGPTRRVLVLVAVVALVAAALAIAIAGSPRYPPPFGLARNGAILYGVDGDIFVRDTVDAPPRLLIDGTDTDWAPLYARRGDKFLFFRGNRETATGDIYLADADGSDVRRLGGPFTAIDTFDITPDSTTALIASEQDGGRMGFTLLPLDGSPGRTIVLPASAIWPLFRPPGGEWISFRMGDPQGPGQLNLVRLDGTGLRKLDLRIDGVGGEHDFTHGMSWSADGTQLAFVSIEDDLPEAGVDAGLRIDIATVDPDGVVTGQRRVEFDPRSDNELNPVFIPGSNKLLFNTREGIVDYVSLGVPGVPGGTILKPGSTGEQGIDYFLSPDSKFALVLNRAEATTWLYDLETLESRPVDLDKDEVVSIQRLAP